MITSIKMGLNKFRGTLTHFFPLKFLKNQFFKKRVFKYSIGDLKCGMRHILRFTPGPRILKRRANRNQSGTAPKQKTPHKSMRGL